MLYLEQSPRSYHLIQKKTFEDPVSIAKTEIKESKIFKDVFAKWIYSQDPTLSIETINALPTEQIVTWNIVCPLDAQPFFQDWLERELCPLYRDKESCQKKVEETLNTIYQKIKSSQNLSADSASVKMVDQLARDILKEYSQIIEEKATDDELLKKIFVEKLGLPAESNMMRLTIANAKEPIRKFVRELFGYLYSDYPRQCLKQVLRHDYPEQIHQVRYLTHIWSKSERTVAPVWEQDKLLGG